MLPIAQDLPTRNLATCGMISDAGIAGAMRRTRGISVLLKNNSAL